MARGIEAEVSPVSVRVFKIVLLVQLLTYIALGAISGYYTNASKKGTFSIIWLSFIFLSILGFIGLRVKKPAALLVYLGLTIVFNILSGFGLLSSFNVLHVNNCVDVEEDRFVNTEFCGSFSETITRARITQYALFCICQLAGTRTVMWILLDLRSAQAENTIDDIASGAVWSLRNK